MKTSSRIAIVDPEKCQPHKCQRECQKFCPVNQTKKECVVMQDRTIQGKSRLVSTIIESACIGCGMCVRKCPFNAITVINLPKPLNDVIFKYGINAFQLSNLPMPKRGSVLGLIGANGCGKTTALQILSKQAMPNFGKLDQVYTENEIIKMYRGTELQNYFRDLYKSNNPLIISLKSQYIESYTKVSTLTVGQYIASIANYTRPQDQADLIWQRLDLYELENKLVQTLSGGQAQRFAIALTLLKEADVYIFDEPSSFLDIRQRLMIAETIRESLLPYNKYVIVVEHDLSVLDYLSDQVCLLYGKPSAYGVSSVPYSVLEGINLFLDGYIEHENMRFRPDSLNFRFGTTEETTMINCGETTTLTEIVYTEHKLQYPQLQKQYKEFQLKVEAGEVSSSQVTVLVGPNGTGKTTFIKLLCGLTKPDNEVQVPVLNVSYKPQILNPKFEGTVEELLYNRIGSNYTNPQFRADVIKPLNLDELLPHLVKTLSGGQLQRVAIVLALGKSADVYLIDEPSAYLDVEQRLAVAKVIKKFIANTHKYCFLVEHDFIMSTYLANQVIVFSQSNSPSASASSSIYTEASSPCLAAEGFNNFLKIAGVTFRRDRSTYRPRINKPNSQNDQIQKASGQYFMFEPTANEVQKSFSISSLGTSSLDW